MGKGRGGPRNIVSAKFALQTQKRKERGREKREQEEISPREPKSKCSSSPSTTAHRVDTVLPFLLMDFC